jgi:hypothetical protein
MHTISSWNNPLSVCAWHQCTTPDHCAQPGYRGLTRQADLQHFKGDSVAMGRLRELVRQPELGLQVSLMSDDQVIEQFTRLLDLGRWRLCQQIATQAWAPAPGVDRIEAEPQREIPRRQAPAPRPVVNVPESTLFPPQHDQAAQANTLIEAANDGVPFCEECEKPRKQKGAN